ncbi:MAG: DNA polymerase III subunit alpha [Bacteroidia bacterium]|nr:DNA polymerase III subunit alpha [Bacteroidia bacterium]
MPGFVHLHVHSQYSVLDGQASIKGLVCKAKADGMPALALTDHGNMFGIKEFHKFATRMGVKPIIGCEMYVAPTNRFDKKVKDNQKNYHHLILLAKNVEGYFNLVKLVSYGWIEGFYYKPRIDKELLRKYSKGLIATTACIAGEIPQAILENDMDKAEAAILEFKEIFGDDFYFELQRHETNDPSAAQDVFPRQQIAGKVFIKLAEKYNVKLVASNDVHFVNPEDADAHDILICLNTQSDREETNRMRYTKQEWFKTQAEMSELFADIPEALENTLEIADKIEKFTIETGPIMPDFPLPDGFSDTNNYLHHLTLEGAKKRYPELSEDIKERIDFELGVIKKMGFPGYFLIVQDFLNAARRMGVAVGPGRGSAAGSVVAYCLKITDIDPLKYDLLFERFLNPDRISMPDIDIDFDDDGREAVLKWVNDKYGKERVAHIITFGTMAAKSSIRDVGRVLKLPLSDADRLAKLVPETPGVTLITAFKEVKELADSRHSDNSKIVETLKFAETLEGSIRSTGIHACGIIIGKDDLINYLPLKTEDNVLVTQYEGPLAEEVGLLKMDFLGLKTLSIIKDAIENIKKTKGIEIDIENIPLDDKVTYELYSRGDTVGTFQFESDGMRKYLKDLKPNKFEDLIAMNALYRPGPMDYIPSFINRKYGREKIEYDFPVMKKRLEETYGITVYQEQVMLLAQDMAGFSRGDSDKLRKAMGKKQKDMMDQMKAKFVDGCKAKGYDETKVLKIWNDWEKFAQYAFNKSHSTCYSNVAYQTAYLKAHHPAEYMAAVLSRNLNNIKEITKYMDECRRTGLQVLGPDINESELKFSVVNGRIRFGMAAIKGVGEGAVQSILDERNKNGKFTGIFNFAERINMNSVNKKSIEGLAKAGAFDCFPEAKRHQYFVDDDSKETSFIETLIRYGNKMIEDKNSNQKSLFGGASTLQITKPAIPVRPEWSNVEKLNKEKEMIGIFLSAHPMDDYKLEIDGFTNITCSDLKDLEKLKKGKDKEFVFAGIVTKVKSALGKNGNPYGRVVIEDYSDSIELMLFGKDWVNFTKFFVINYALLVKGKVQPKFGDKDQKDMEFKITGINMLSDVKDEMIKNISIKIPIQNLTQSLIEEFNTLAEANKGKIHLNFLIYEPAEKIWIEMFSRTHKIKLSSEFIAYLNNNTEIETFKIN